MECLICGGEGWTYDSHGDEVVCQHNFNPEEPEWYGESYAEIPQEDER